MYIELVPSFNIKLHKLHLLKRFLMFFSYIFFYFYVIPTFYHVYCFVIFVTKNNVKNEGKKKKLFLNIIYWKHMKFEFIISRRCSYLLFSFQSVKLQPASWKENKNCVFVSYIYLCILLICNWNLKYIWVGIACVVRGIQTAVSYSLTQL